METPREYYYTYYSYEEYGRGYFGSRKCYCPPEEDIKYFGSSKDKTFKPTQKIILKSDYNTREEAYADEIILQQYYKVVENTHFANRAYQTSTKFHYIVPTKDAIENGKRGGKKVKELGLGIFAMTPEQRSENSKKYGHLGAKKTKELGTGLYGLTPEQRSCAGKKSNKKQKELGIGIYALTPEQRTKNGKIGSAKAKEMGVGIFAQTKEQRSELGKRTKELKLGVFGLTTEQRSENSRKAGSIGGKIGGKTNAKNKTGVCGRSKEQMAEDGRKGGLKAKELGIGVHAIPKEIKSEMGRNNMKKLNKQKWKCTETGFVSSPGALTNYQKVRNIDTSKRVRIL